MKQSVYNSVSFFLIVIDLELVTKALLGLIDLIKTPIFYIHKLKKIFIVYNNNNLIFTIL